MLCLGKFFGKSQIVFGNLKLDFKSLGLNTLSQRDWSFIKIINIDL